MRAAKRANDTGVALVARAAPLVTARTSAGYARSAGAGTLVAMVLVAAAYFVPRGLSWNADSHLFLTASIADRGVLSIDPLARYTGDVAAAHGHFYSDKAPGLSLLAIPAYALLKLTLLGGESLTSVYAMPEAHRVDFLVRYVLALVYAGIPTAIAAALLYRFLPRLGLSARWSAGLALTYALGTIARPFAAQFFSHQLAATLLLGAFVLLYRIRHGELSRRYLPWAGGLLGYAIITEYPTALIAFCLGLYALWPVPRGARVDEVTRPARRRPSMAGSLNRVKATLADASTVRWAAALLMVGAAAPLALGALYNTLAFGGPLSTGYAHLAGPDVFRAGQSQGLLGITAPHFDAIWSTTIGPYRGIFVLSPVLLLAIPGFRALLRLPRWRYEGILLLSVVGLYALFSVSYYMWDGGFSMGPRQFLPALPFLFLPIGVLLRAAGGARWRHAAVILSIGSISVVELATSAGPLADPKYPSPLTDWALPRLLAGTLENNWGMVFGLPGLLQLVPLALALGLLYLRLWRITRQPATLPARNDSC